MISKGWPRLGTVTSERGLDYATLTFEVSCRRIGKSDPPTLVTLFPCSRRIVLAQVCKAWRNTLEPPFTCLEQH